MSAAKPGSAVERERSRAYMMHSQETAQGWQTWECDRGDEDALESYLEGSTWTVNGHVMVTKSITVLPQGEEGLAIVRAEYGTFYNPWTHPVGKATISVRTTSAKTPAAARPVADVKDATGAVVWEARTSRMLPTEPGEDDGFYYDWAETTAPPKTLQHGSVVAIRTAYRRAGINWNMILGAYDKVNMYTLPNLGNAAPRTMKLIGASVPQYFVLGDAFDIVPINFLMQYDEEGWTTDRAYAQKYRRTVMGLPMVKSLNANGTILAYYDNYGEECADEADARKVPTTINRKIGSEIECYGNVREDFATFTHLMGLITWL